VIERTSLWFHLLLTLSVGIGGLRHDGRRALALAPLSPETGKPIDIGIAKHHAIPDDLRKRAYTSFGLAPRVAKAAQTKNPDPMRNAACGMVGSGSTAGPVLGRAGIPQPSRAQRVPDYRGIGLTSKEAARSQVPREGGRAHARPR
jgi:hypothetical protein